MKVFTVAVLWFWVSITDSMVSHPHHRICFIRVRRIVKINLDSLHFKDRFRRFLWISFFFVIILRRIVWIRDIFNAVELVIQGFFKSGISAFDREIAGVGEIFRCGVRVAVIVVVHSYAFPEIGFKFWFGNEVRELFSLCD
ncbi:hypothetical protein C475_22354 [Halosimplex carlsbadense 2-9-1]|uniref:Uncharacterized protein n=1 Tax=Halosimplex carlsbadense 2-9-1 TaxID=797114 RepID=M0CBK0_9EURY|nr:hypothetical protein C475_22354 [Halosimplex carlsbadense 2-9-1]